MLTIESHYKQLLVTGNSYLFFRLEMAQQCEQHEQTVFALSSEIVKLQETVKNCQEQLGEEQILLQTARDDLTGEKRCFSTTIIVFHYYIGLGLGCYIHFVGFLTYFNWLK